eukprot:6211968-Pleurochrysis_carterae.AAC.1
MIIIPTFICASFTHGMLLLIIVGSCWSQLAYPCVNLSAHSGQCCWTIGYFVQMMCPHEFYNATTRVQILFYPCAITTFGVAIMTQTISAVMADV